MWNAAADPSVLRARLLPAAGAAWFDLRRWLHRVVSGADHTHLRLHLPDGVLRLDLVGRVDLGRYLAIEPAIDLGRAIEPQMATVRRLASLARINLVAHPEQRLVRLVEALRVADALATGASLREIGLGAFGGEWPGDGEYLKSKVRRRVTLAGDLLSAGPLGVIARRI